MKIAEITSILEQIFNSGKIEQTSNDTWQIQQENLRLLVILAEDHSWMRILVPIATVAEAQPFLTQLLAANFEDTQEVRYATKF